ncbi:MAG: hypothetical protein KJ826_16800 [Proteobacteria bacterium]|nr:hypothetical protein [Pseudomonadota bacterium]
MKKRNKKQMYNTIQGNFCKSLNEASTEKCVGGKASNLSKVQAIGMRVPQSFVLLNTALSEFLRYNGLERMIRNYLNSFETESNKDLINQYNQICRKVLDVIIPPAIGDEVSDLADRLLSKAPGGLAIRSSATVEDDQNASFAGVFESFLGCSEISETMEYVKRVWSSLWAPKSIHYMKIKGIDPLIFGFDGMAVIIQKVVPARCSGVIHTADTKSGNPWQFVLNATEGLSALMMGESGVGDRLVLDWETGTILEQEIGEKSVRLDTYKGTVRKRRMIGNVAWRPALETSDIKIIAGMARALDEKFDMRMDIEWAFDEKGIMVLQARPLTALPKFFPHVLSDEEKQQRWWACTFNGNPRPGVFNGTPQPGAEFIPPFFRDLSSQEMWMRYQPEGLVFYADPDKEDKDFNGYRFATTVKWRTLTDYFKDDVELESWLMDNESTYRREWARFWVELDEIVNTSSEANRKSTNVIDLIPVLLSVREAWADLTAMISGAPQGLGFICEGLLERFYKEYVSEDFNVSIMQDASTESFTFQQTKALQELGKSIDEETVRKAFRNLPASEIIPWLLEADPDCVFLRRFESFCWRFGRRLPRWTNRKSLVDKGIMIRVWSGKDDVQAVSAIKAAFLLQAQDVEIKREEALSRGAKQMKKIYDFLSNKDHSLLERFDRIISWASFWNQVLNDRHAITIAVNWLYELLWQVGCGLCEEGLFDEPADVLALYPEDLKEIIRLKDICNLTGMFRSRKRECLRNRRLTPPALIGKPFDWEPKKDNSEALSKTNVRERNQLIDRFLGQGNCRGKATGKARKTAAAEDSAFLDSITPDDIIIITVPMVSAFFDWHSLLMTARGVVSAGKPYHHLVHVANECDVPLIWSVQGDLSAIPDQAMVRIDSDSGKISLLLKNE